MIGALTSLVALAAFAVSLFTLLVNEGKLRLDLYNKRFDIYVRIIRFYAVYFKPDDENFASLHNDFVTASLESQFLFSPDSGIPSLLRCLNEDSFIIIRQKDLPNNLPAEQQRLQEEQFFKAIKRWNESIPLLEARMAEYLNFHHTSASAEALSRLRAWTFKKFSSVPPANPGR